MKYHKRTLLLFAAFLAFTALLLGAALSFKKFQYKFLKFSIKNKGVYSKIEAYGSFVNKYPSDIPSRLDLAKYYQRLSLSEFILNKPEDKRIEEDLSSYMNSQLDSYEKPEEQPQDKVKQDLSKTSYTDAAIKQYEEILKLNPKEKKALIGLSEMYMRQKDLDKVEQTYQKLLELDPENNNIRLKLVSIYQSRGDMDKSLDETEKAISYDPNNGAAYMIQAAIYSKKGRIVEALDAYKKAARRYKKAGLKNEEAGARYLLGRLYLGSGLLFDAAQQFKKTIKLRPEMLLSYIDLARTFFLLHLDNKAVSTLTESPLDMESWDIRFFIEKVPNALKGRTYDILGKIYLRKKDYARSLEYLINARARGIRYKDDFIEALEKLAERQQKQLSGEGENTAPEKNIDIAGVSYMLEQEKLYRPPELEWKKKISKYKIGSSHEGLVSYITAFGMHIELEEGVEGWLMIDPTEDTKKIFYPGDIVTVKIQRIDPIQRIVYCKLEGSKHKKTDDVSIKKQNSSS